MNRRIFAGALAGLAASGVAKSAEADRRTRFYTLDVFQLRNGTQTARMHDWFGNVLLPKVSQLHSGPTIVLEAVIGAHSPQLAWINGFSSTEEIWGLHTKVTADRELAAARAKLDQGSEPPYENQSSTLIEAAPYSTEIATEKRDKPRLFELRVYHSPTVSQLHALHERFAGPETKIFARSGIHPVLYGTTLMGSNMPNLTYLIPFDSLGAREKAWDTFGADPEWIKARKDSIDKAGEIVSVSDLSIYRATAYSPVK